jgi:hypothetical protein
MKTQGEAAVAEPLGKKAVNKWVFVAKLGDDDSPRRPLRDGCDVAVRSTNSFPCRVPLRTSKGEGSALPPSPRWG